MEEKKLIEADRRGGHCVLFSNTFGLKIDTIKDIFSEFGDLREVRSLGPKTFHFVTYKTLDSAERAVDGLKDHPCIKLRYHTPGKKNNKAAGESKNPTPDTPKHKKNVKNNNNDSGNKSKNIVKPKPEKSVKIEDSGALPDLVDPRGRSMPSNYVPRKVLPATELVFANIHPRFDLYYLLHLLKPYDPVAISQIHPSQRFCLVYLKTSDLAEEVENAYDGKVLAGRYLLVLRTTKLIEESENCI